MVRQIASSLARVAAQALLTACTFAAPLALHGQNVQTSESFSMNSSAPSSTAQWIWSSTADPAPVNRFTWFRKVVDLPELPADATLLFAADSTARLLINGQIVRRKVARYDEPRIHAEVVNAGPYLRPGRNVLTVLHHNWGPIITFQRTGNKHAGLYVGGSWVGTDASWRWTTATEYLAHEQQIVGIAGGAHRIRFPVVLDGGKMPSEELHRPEFDDSSWAAAVPVVNGPWEKTPPPPVETPGQREHEVPPYSVLAAGELRSEAPGTSDVLAIAEAIRTADCRPVDMMTTAARDLLLGKPVTLHGKAGQSLFVTLDFARPVHGYPVLGIVNATAGVQLDLGYCEIPFSPYDGELHVRPNGWINPTGVVGRGYADRYICRTGAQQVEIPEERTARWLALHVHFPEDGQLVLGKAGFIKSQYPIKPIGSFECGDPVMDQIVRLCITHAEVTMTDAYVDTPGREDGQWIEDAQLRALVSERWFGDTHLRRFMIRTHAESQGKDGQTHPFAPSNYPAYPATYDWSVQWVATLWDEYQWSRDEALLREYWGVLTKYWGKVLSHVNEEGLWQTPHVLADIRVGAHPSKPHHSSGIVTPIIIERLEWSAAMAAALGETEQASEWRRTADRMKTAFRRFHVVETSGTVPRHVADYFDPSDSAAQRGFSQAGQIASGATGILPTVETREMLEYSFPAPEGDPPKGVTRWNNPTNSYRALKALSRVGLTSRAVAHLKERFREYLPGTPVNPVPDMLQGPFGGPLPEYWISRRDLGLQPGEKNTAQPDDLTGSHGWPAVPLYWLHEHLLGVTLAEPGGARLRIAPDAGGLPYVSGWTNTPRGPVHVYYDPQQWLVEVTLPSEVKAQVVFPPEFQGKRIKGGRKGESPAEADIAASELTGPGEFFFMCY